MLSDMDINAIAGTLKLYFRELPEPLLTDRLYPAFMEGIGKALGMRRCLAVLLLPTILLMQGWMPHPELSLLAPSPLGSCCQGELHDAPSPLTARPQPHHFPLPAGALEKVTAWRCGAGRAAQPLA